MDRIRSVNLEAALLFAALLGCGSEQKSAAPGKTCDQACLDGAIVFATWLSVDATLYNDEVVDHTLPRTGVACPGGGTVDISGTATSSGGTNSLDLTYVMSGCHFTASGYDLTFTGTLAETGSFNNTTKVTNLAYKSASLGWTGSVGYSSSQYPAKDAACTVSISRTSSLSGSLCGRPEAAGTLPPL